MSNSLSYQSYYTTEDNNKLILSNINTPLATIVCQISPYRSDSSKALQPKIQKKKLVIGLFEISINHVVCLTVFLTKCQAYERKEGKKQQVVNF